MGTIADKLASLTQAKAAIRDAIISKGQALAESDPISSYAAKIEAIQTGIDTSSATAAADDILEGKTAYVNGEKVAGAMQRCTLDPSEIGLATDGKTLTVSVPEKHGRIDSGSGTLQRTIKLSGMKYDASSPNTCVPQDISIPAGAVKLKLSSTQFMVTSDGVALYTVLYAYDEDGHGSAVTELMFAGTPSKYVLKQM